jgi:ESCRT-I complex subunit TSG101
MVFVIPTQDMVVRPGQHVSGEGRVYHHYLAHWADAWDVSGLTLFKSLDQTSSFKLSR